MHFYVRLETDSSDRAHFSCRSWREVRWLTRIFEREGFTVHTVRRIRRRWNWLGERTEARHECRALTA